jgi:hypothetical protein
MTNELPTIEKPASAPKAKKPVDTPLPMPSDAEAEVSELEMEYEHYFSMADEMLRSIVRENRKPTFAEQTFFKGRCGWDEKEVLRQIGRMTAVLRYKAVAGTAVERLAASDEQTKAAEILASEGPKIDEQIAKLSEQKDALAKNATRSQRVVEQIDTAVESLRSVDLLRADLKAKYHGKRREFGERDWTRLGAVGTEVSFRQQMLKPVEDERKLVDALGTHFPDCRKYDEWNHRYVIEGESWEARKKTMRMELVELQDEFDRLTKLKAEQMESLEPMRDFYLLETK